MTSPVHKVRIKSIASIELLDERLTTDKAHLRLAREYASQTVEVANVLASANGAAVAYQLWLGKDVRTLPAFYIDQDPLADWLQGDQAGQAHGYVLYIHKDEPRLRLTKTSVKDPRAWILQCDGETLREFRQGLGQLPTYVAFLLKPWDYGAFVGFRPIDKIRLCILMHGSNLAMTGLAMNLYEWYNLAIERGRLVKIEKVSE